MPTFKATFAGAREVRLPYRCQSCGHACSARVRLVAKAETTHGRYGQVDYTYARASAEASQAKESGFAGKLVDEAAEQQGLAILGFAPCPSCGHRNRWKSYIMEKGLLLALGLILPCVGLNWLAQKMSSWIFAGTLAVIALVAWIFGLIMVLDTSSRWRGNVDFE
jgi:hypothetical protein